MAAVTGVMHCDVDASIWLVYKAAKEEVLERLAEEKTEWGVLNDVSM